MKDKNLFYFLPDFLYKAISYLNLNKLYEIRIRADRPIKINYNGEYKFLSGYGDCEKKESALVCSLADIEKIVFQACERSIYSVTEQIKQGFITTNNGARIGLGGMYVYDGNTVTTIKDVSSLTIRIPHEVENCSLEVFNACFLDGLKSVLIISPPACGKTTMLRDLCRKISENYNVNILVSDERNEICARIGNSKVDFGNTTDVITYARKDDAFSSGIRAMRPDLIVTDEIVNCNEVDALIKTKHSGVEVLASAHFKDIEFLKDSKMFDRALAHRIFDYYVVLSHNIIGKIDKIFNKDLQEVFRTND